MAKIILRFHKLLKILKSKKYAGKIFREIQNVTNIKLSLAFLHRDTNIDIIR